MEWSKYDNMFRKFQSHDDGTITSYCEQDLAPALDYSKEKRDNEAIRPGEEFRHYARVPMVIVEHIMAKYGITSLGKELSEVLFPEIDINYPYLKTTNTNERSGKIPSIIGENNL
jgi:DNA-directed RNA polymerase specialized sigma54-like protein